jgi:hypothetical protein
LLDDRGEMTATNLPFHDIPIDADDSMDASGERANAVSHTGSTRVTAAVLEMSITSIYEDVTGENWRNPYFLTKGKP